ncbi:hypothetical protein ABZT51_42605, partial [Streptomyces sp. NPDC005373]
PTASPHSPPSWSPSATPPADHPPAEPPGQHARISISPEVVRGDAAWLLAEHASRVPSREDDVSVN